MLQAASVSIPRDVVLLLPLTGFFGPMFRDRIRLLLPRRIQKFL